MENTRPAIPDAEPVVSSGMLTTIDLFYLPLPKSLIRLLNVKSPARLFPVDL